MDSSTFKQITRGPNLTVPLELGVRNAWSREDIHLHVDSPSLVVLMYKRYLQSLSSGVDIKEETCLDSSLC